MIDLIEFYRTYGEILASRVGPCSFVFVEDMGDPAEVLQFLNSGGATAETQLPQFAPEFSQAQFDGTRIGSAVLVWEQFSETVDTGGRDNFHTELHGSLAILQKGADRAGRRLAQRYARLLILEALAEMLRDSEEGSLLDENIRLAVRQLPLSVIGPVGANWYGYGLEFSWLVPLDLTPAD